MKLIKYLILTIFIITSLSYSGEENLNYEEIINLKIRRNSKIIKIMGNLSFYDFNHKGFMESNSETTDCFLSAMSDISTLKRKERIFIYYYILTSISLDGHYAQMYRKSINKDKAVNEVYDIFIKNKKSFDHMKNMSNSESFILDIKKHNDNK